MPVHKYAFAQKMRSARLALRMTEPELARRSGVGAARIRRLERASPPTDKEANSIAGVLGFVYDETTMTKRSVDKVGVFARLKTKDIERLDALVSRMPFASRSAMAHAAILIGIRELERDATILLQMRDELKDDA